MDESEWDEDEEFTEDAFEQCDILASQALTGVVNSTSNILNQRIVLNSTTTTNQSDATFVLPSRISSNNRSSVSYSNRVPPHPAIQRKQPETVPNDTLQMKKQLQQYQQQISELLEKNMILNGEISMVRREIDTKEKENEKEAKRKQQEWIEKLNVTQMELDRSKVELAHAKTEIRFKEQEQITLNERLRCLKSGNKTVNRPPSPPQQSPPKRRKLSNERVAAFPTISDFERVEVKPKSSEKAVQCKTERSRIGTINYEDHSRCELQKKLIDDLENVNVEKQDEKLLKDIMLATAGRIKEILKSLDELKSRRRKKKSSKLPEELMRKVQSTNNVLLWINELTLIEASRCSSALQELRVRDQTSSRHNNRQIKGLDEEMEELLTQLVKLLGAGIQTLCCSVVQLTTTFVIYAEGVKSNKILSVMISVINLLEEMNDAEALAAVTSMVKLLREIIVNSSLEKQLINHDQGPSTAKKLLAHIADISKRLTVDESEELCWDVMRLAGCDSSSDEAFGLGCLFLVLTDHLDKWRHQSVDLGAEITTPIKLFSSVLRLCRRLQCKRQVTRINSPLGLCHISWFKQLQKMQPIISLPSEDVMILSEILDVMENPSPSEEEMELDNS